MAERPIEDIMAEIEWKQMDHCPDAPPLTFLGLMPSFRQELVNGERRRLEAMRAAGLVVTRADDGR